MGLELPQETTWAVRALQGLAFWIGHREAMYNGYPLSEGALVAETCNLIHSALPKHQVLRCQELYRNLLPPGATMNVITKQARADLVIANEAYPKAKVKDRFHHVQHVIEVKRSTAPAPAIRKDLQRLHEAVKEGNGQFRGLLFLVTDRVSAPPSGFATATGSSEKGVHDIDGGGFYVVRRTCKASAKFESYNNAYYACLIEVFQHKPTRQELSGKLARPKLG